MLDFSSLPEKRIALFVGVLGLGGVLGGYALHEHHTAQSLAADDAQNTAALTATKQQLSATREQVSDLTAKVNQLVERSEATTSTPAAATPSGKPHAARTAASRRQHEDPRFKKLQSQLDAQGKAIEQTRADLAGTQGDLVNTRTELTGSIAHTHSELVALERKGERSYFEFDISKSKEFKHEGPFSLRLKKANEKHQYADMELIVDDRNLSQKHINLYQPIMFSTPDAPQPAEIVINNISKDHIHGYVSAPKYKQSELAQMADSDNNANGAQGGSEQSQQPPARKKLSLPQ